MADRIERLAMFLAELHPAWKDTHWREIGEETRELFRQDARRAAEILEGRAR